MKKNFFQNAYSYFYGFYFYKSLFWYALERKILKKLKGNQFFKTAKAFGGFLFIGEKKNDCCNQKEWRQKTT